MLLIWPLRSLEYNWKEFSANRVEVDDDVLFSGGGNSLCFNFPARRKPWSVVSLLG